MGGRRGAAELVCVCEVVTNHYCCSYTVPDTENLANNHCRLMTVAIYTGNPFRGVGGRGGEEKNGREIKERNVRQRGTCVISLLQAFSLDTHTNMHVVEEQKYNVLCKRKIMLGWSRLQFLSVSEPLDEPAQNFHSLSAVVWLDVVS